MIISCNSRHRYTFRSADANCEVVELKNGSGALIARRNIAVGDWLSVLPSDSDDDDDDD